MSDQLRTPKKKHRRSGSRRRSRRNARVRPKGSEEAKEEVSAGGIVYKRTPDGIRVAFILDPYGKWSFAKGHVEAGETIEQAAIRETKEEMGLSDIRLIKPLGQIDLWFRDRYRAESRGKLIHKYVHYFLMEAPADAKGRPEKEEKIKRIIWVPVRSMLRRSSYEDVRFLLKRAKRHLITLPGGNSGGARREGNDHRSSFQRNRHHGKPSSGNGRPASGNGAPQQKKP
jgi:ADP-ribose pyrophosphatase YjhB (NUDIX family)